MQRDLEAIGRPFGEFILGGNAAEPGQIDKQIEIVKQLEIQGKKVVFYSSFSSFFVLNGCHSQINHDANDTLTKEATLRSAKWLPCRSRHTSSEPIRVVPGEQNQTV